MYYSKEYFDEAFGVLEPDVSGMKVGDTVIYCGHCGHQRPVNTVGLSKCPECRKTMIVGTVTEEDLC